jgi:hypothetical protein
MDLEKFRELLAGYQDGELSPKEKEMVEQALSEHPELRAELAELERVKEVTAKVTYRDLPQEIWDTYWQNIYRRLERGLGWIFLSIGAIVLSAYGCYYLLHDFFFDPTVTILAKIGVGGLVLGGIFLLVSVIRERLFAYKRERYKEVIR